MAFCFGGSGLPPLRLYPLGPPSGCAVDSRCFAPAPCRHQPGALSCVQDRSPAATPTAKRMLSSPGQEPWRRRSISRARFGFDSSRSQASPTSRSDDRRHVLPVLALGLLLTLGGERCIAPDAFDFVPLIVPAQRRPAVDQGAVDRRDRRVRGPAISHNMIGMPGPDRRTSCTIFPVALLYL